MFDKNSIQNFIHSIPIQELIAHTRFKYPHESCGYLFNDGQYYAGHNIISSLNIPSLTTNNAFFIDHETTTRAFQREDLIGIFHSHTNGSADMSDADKELLNSSKLLYLIIGIINHDIKEIKIHWWEKEVLQSLDLHI